MDSGQMKLKRLVTGLLRSPVFLRWVDIILLSAFVIVIVVIMEQYMSGMLNRLSEELKPWPSSLRHAVTALLVTIASIILIRLGALFAHFPIGTMLRYPPVWFSPLLIAILIFFLSLYKDTVKVLLWLRDDYFELVMTFCMACGGVLLAFAYELFESNRSLPTKTSARRQSLSHQTRNLFDSDEDLLAWIFEESPIQHPNDDVFGHKIPARRIAGLLLQASSSSIGIVGVYGSGKSSLIELVWYYLTHKTELGPTYAVSFFPGNVIRCKIAGWGRGSGTVAQKILALSIEEVKRYIDCVSIIGLPGNYRNALAGAKSAGGAVISALLQTSQDPIAQLSKLDNILAAANTRLIIFLEDLDRNVCDEIIRDEMPALLDRLRILGQVSFVLAIGTERQYSDILVRICDHVEAIS